MGRACGTSSTTVRVEIPPVVLVRPPISSILDGPQRGLLPFRGIKEATNYGSERLESRIGTAKSLPTSLKG